MPVRLSDENASETLRVQLAAVEQDLQHCVVGRLRHMVRRLFVIRIGAALEKQARHASVLRNAGGSLNRGLDHLPWACLCVDGLVPTRVRTGTSVKQGASRVKERLRP